MAAGLGFKTFVTGEVLTAGDTNGYLMQGVLVFASAAARDAAITSPQEGQCCYLKDTDAVLTYSGSAWVGFDDSNAVQNTIVDAKGDLIAASAADTPARLAAGNNGEALYADSAATTGLRYSATPSASNPVLNSAMQNWQRGTSISLAASAGTTYLADRYCTQTGANQACTVSRQVTGDTTNLPFIQYALRYQRNSGQTGTGGLALMQPMETVNSVPFASKTVTMSFYARAGANYTAASNALAFFLRTGTGTDQNPFAGYTGDALTINSTATLTTTWQRFTATATVPTTTTQMTTQFSYTPVGTASTNDYYEVTGVQLDIGSVALPFRTYAATIQSELAACQRYFNRIADFSSGGANSEQKIVTAQNFATTGGFGVLQYPIMRTTPSVTFSSNTDFIATGSAGNNITTTAMAANAIKPNSCEIRYTVASGLVAGNAALCYTTSSTGKLDLSAEL